MTSYMLCVICLSLTSSGAQSAAAGHAQVAGRFKRYLETPNGNVDGVVLRNGTVARFSPRKAAQVAHLHPGELVRVEGDAVRGLGVRYLVHASVVKEKLGEGPSFSAAYVPAAHDAPESPAVRRAATPAPDSAKHPDDVLFAKGLPPLRPKPGILGDFAAKIRQATTGTSASHPDSRLGRARENEGP